LTDVLKYLTNTLCISKYFLFTLKYKVISDQSTPHKAKLAWLLDRLDHGGLVIVGDDNVVHPFNLLQPIDNTEKKP